MVRDELYIKLGLAGRFGIKPAVETSEGQGMKPWPRAPPAPKVRGHTNPSPFGSILHKKVFLMVTFHTNSGKSATFKTSISYKELL